MMPGSSCTSWKSVAAGGVPDKFPAGLRVLVVDDDPTCLVILEKMLKKCNYEVTICNRAEIGLSLLRENKNGYDIVLSDVHMPDMDGFKLLEHIGLEMDLPVIMMSADDSNSVVLKGVTHGACDYLIKPVRLEALRNIWQHVVRRRKNEWKDFEPLTSADDVDQHQKVPEDADYTSSANEGHKWKNARRRRDDEDESEEREESSAKKPRVVWSVELHRQFVAAVNQLGIDKAVPKKILELMNVPGISRENVASHLQKYRLYLRRLSGSQHLGSMDTSFMGIPDAGYDLQTLGVGGQLPGQSLATLQAAVIGHSTHSKSPISMPVIDQRNTYSFDNSMLRYGEVNRPHLLHGIPTNMQPKQFVSLHQSRHHSLSGVNSQVLMPMAGQGQGQSQSQNQPVLPNGLFAHGLGKVSGTGFVPNYNVLNDSRQMRPSSSFPNQSFNEWLSYLACKKTQPAASSAVDDESRTQRNDDNQDDLLSAILKQPQENFGQLKNDIGFDGYALDDLPRVT